MRLVKFRLTASGLMSCLTLCLAAFAGLISSHVSADDSTDTPAAYQISIGEVVLAPEAIQEDLGGTEYFVAIVRHDPLLEGELKAVQAEELILERQERSVERSLRQKRRAGANPNNRNIRRIRGNSRAPAIRDNSKQQDRLETQVHEIRTQLTAIREEKAGLQADLSVRTPSQSISGLRLDFSHEKLPLTLREGQIVSFILYEDDVGSDDLVGTTTIVLDKETLSSEYLSLSLDRVELLEVQVHQEG